MLETFVASPLIGGSSSIVTRLLQRYFPTPLEKAQHENILQSMKIAREEIAAREARAEKDLEVRRELLLTQIDASAKQDENRNEMQRWPLGPTAAAIVRASQKRKGSALNVIVVPNSRILNDEDPQKLGACWSAFNVAVDRMQDTAAKYFGEDVLFYWENIRPQNARPPLRGQELVSTVYALTSTEPTALIQVALLNGRTLQLSWSTWGWVGDEGEPDSGNVQIEINPDEPALDKVFERAQTALICALSDRFQLLRCIQSAREPKFVSVNAFVSNVAMTIYNGNTDEYDVASASESLVESYITSLDKIAQNAPYLAADFAASAALRLNMKSDPKAADRLLQCALNYYRAGLPEQESEKEVIGSLMERFFDGPSPQKIQLALRDVRHLSYSDYISKGKIDEVDETLLIDELESSCNLEKEV